MILNMEPLVTVLITRASAGNTLDEKTFCNGVFTKIFDEKELRIRLITQHKNPLPKNLCSEKSLSIPTVIFLL